MKEKITSIVNKITGNKKESPYKIIHLSKTGEQEPRYYLFRTKDVKEYLKFLEKFDEVKYEIINISTSMNSVAYGNQEFYMITYKKIF